MKKSLTLKFGLLGTLALLGVFVGQYLIFGIESFGPEYYTISEIVGYSTMFISMIIAGFGIKAFRDQKLGGYITYGQGVKFGLLTALVPALAFGIYTVILYVYFIPGFAEEYYQYGIEQVQASGMPQAEIDKEVAYMEGAKDLFLNPWFSGALMFITVYIIGAIVTLVMAGVFQKKPKAVKD